MGLVITSQYKFQNFRLRISRFREFKLYWGVIEREKMDCTIAAAGTFEAFGTRQISQNHGF